jgi:hypothetical protein
MDASCRVNYIISLLIPSQHNNNKVRNIILNGTLLHVSAFGSHHQENTLNVFSSYGIAIPFNSVQWRWILYIRNIYNNIKHRNYKLQKDKSLKIETKLHN